MYIHYSFADVTIDELKGFLLAFTPTLEEAFGVEKVKPIVDEIITEYVTQCLEIPLNKLAESKQPPPKKVVTKKKQKHTTLKKKPAKKANEEEA
jgi:hypothetical protein